MKVKEVIAPLEEFAPLSLGESYDNPGLLVGDPEADIQSALLCVDITEAVLEEAIGLGAGLVISHHPIIFHPLRHITGATYIERVVARAISQGIALYASHTNLDSAPGGMSHRLGNLLGLTNVSILESTPSLVSGTGFGVVGDAHRRMSTLDYLAYVKEILRVEVIKYSNVTRPFVGRVALCTGSGSSLIHNARRASADLYISSEFKYNDYLDADRDLVIADVGHFESEYLAIDLMGDIIRKKISTFALHKSRESVNPVNYLV